MMFKNLTVYQTPRHWLPPTITQGLFQPCGAFQNETFGWVSPREDGDLMPVVGGQAMLALRREKRLLPASVITAHVKKMAADIEAQQGFKPGRRQMRDLKEQAIDNLTPKAFCVQQTTNVWIDPVHGRLCVDTANASRAEQVIEHLFASLEPFTIIPTLLRKSCAEGMREWLTNEDGLECFTVDRDCTLRGLDRNEIKYVNEPLGDAVRAQMEAGKRPTKLALTYDDRVSFMLNEQFGFSRIELLNITRGHDNAEQSADQKFDSDFTLMSGELSLLIHATAEALGGFISE